jgi:hypothetical protein
MTHDEIWDDSALVKSWNDALDEYKVSKVILGGGGTKTLARLRRLTPRQKYHSIYKKGASLDDASRPAKG